ncbi:MAG TPA: hypothetical protein VLV50_14495 [Stellaceae bacterium]|nr:hypothetical protein [Stellaceae bacterium]
MSASARTLGAGPLAGLAAIVLAAFLLRFLLIVLTPNLHQPDEIYQSIEQAHRLVYGTGLVPWEFQYGARSWLVPGALAGVMWLARLVGDGPAYYLPAIFAALSLLSTSCVVIAFLWGRRFYGLAGGFVAAWAMALSADAVYFGPRAGQEEIAAHLLVIAAYLAEPGYRPQGRARLIVAGLVFGLVFDVRYHLAPALAVIVLWAGWGAWRARLAPVLAGAFASALAGGLLDWPTWGFPFASVWYNSVYNSLYGVNASFGAGGGATYFALLALFWGAGIAIIPFLAVIGSYRLPMLGVAALVTFAEYTALPHKELRILYPAILLAVMLAALGLARLAVWAEARLRAEGRIPAHAWHTCGLAAAGLWALFSAGESASGGYAPLWRQDENALRAALAVAAMPSACGVGLWGMSWPSSGGYSYLHVPGPLYLPKDEAELARETAGFNTLVALGHVPDAGAFRVRECFGGFCVAQREGECARVPGELVTGIPAGLDAVAPLVPP